MKIKEVTVTYSRTKNTGNYNSRRVELGVTATLDPGTEPEDSIPTAQVAIKLLYSKLKGEADRLLDGERG